MNSVIIHSPELDEGISTHARQPAINYYSHKFWYPNNIIIVNIFLNITRVHRYTASYMFIRRYLLFSYCIPVLIFKLFRKNSHVSFSLHIIYISLHCIAKLLLCHFRVISEWFTCLAVHVHFAQISKYICVKYRHLCAVVSCVCVRMSLS